jgi:surface-anchored protein
MSWVFTEPGIYELTLSARLRVDQQTTKPLDEATFTMAVGVPLVGLYISWSWDFPTGGTIVLVLTAGFLTAWVLSPRHGLLARYLRRVTDDGVIGDAGSDAGRALSPGGP